MHDAEENLLLDQPEHQPQQQHHIRPQPSRIPAFVCQLFEQYRQSLMANVSHQNQTYLVQLHQYYDRIIAELKHRINQLQHQLAKLQHTYQPLEMHSDPGSPRSKPNIQEANHSPVTVDFCLENEEESLLDGLPTDHKPTRYHAPKLVESIIFDTLDDAHTSKKQRSSYFKSIVPSSLRGRFDEAAQQSSFKVDGVFEAELKNMKDELGMLRDALAKQGIDPYAHSDHGPAPKEVCIQLLEVEQSRHVKEHLTNENNQLRIHATQYRRHLQAISPQLSALKQLLLHALQGEE